MAIIKGTTIELEYTGRLEDGKVFDTTNLDVAKQSGIFNPRAKYQTKIIHVGWREVISGLDDDLIGKEVGQLYHIVIPAENAFGKRDIKKIKIVPADTFREHKIQPYPGLQVIIDGELGIVNSTASGRIIVNFNHYLAGKKVMYDYKIIKVIDDQKEEIR